MLNIVLPGERKPNLNYPMARSLPIQYEGGIYHVTLRGNERKAIVL